MLKLYFFIFVLFFCFSCTNKNISTSFYHWKQKLDLSNAEKQYINNTNCKKIYVKFFDIVKSNNTIKPISKLNTINYPTGKEIVPCVYITNNVFKLTSKNKKIKELVYNIIKLINKLYTNPKQYKEIQIDCDWSLGTKHNYFYFLNYLKSQLKNKTLSCTIRLHQIKYKNKTGIPPVDIGMLMFYNMGNIKDINERNSILNLNIAKQYIAKLNEYPLKLNIGLPTYTWAIQIRNKKAINIINSNDYQILETRNFLKIAENTYKLKSSGYYFNKYLYKDDILKIECIDYKDLLKSSELLKNRINNNNLEIIYYHLNTNTINKFSYEKINTITNSFY